MAFQQPSPFVLNTPMQVAQALRYQDANGNIVSQLYPIDYLSLTGSAAGNLTTQMVQVNNILNGYQVTLNSLQTQITAINTSGVTAIPQVNGGCLNSNLVVPVNVATALLISNTCSYNSVLGTPTLLAQAILAEGSVTLNTLPAYSQNSAMAGLSGWNSTPQTIADSTNNLWLAYRDMRSGVTNALGLSGCSQVKVDAQVVLPLFSTGFNIYFDGYTLIPSGYTDTGSTIRIVDSNGNQATNGINIITQSNINSPYNFATSGTTLQSGSGITYTVYINSSVANAALGVSCQKTVVKTISSSTLSGGPDIGNYTNLQTSATTATYPLITGLLYTPRFVSVVPKSSTTGSAMSNYYLTYTAGGANITFNTNTQPVNIDWAAFK